MQALPRPSPSLAWRPLQFLALFGAVVLLAMLFFSPAQGLTLFWDVLIPLAPALLVFFPGLWRNLCPLATFSQLPQRWGWQRLLPLSPAGFDRLSALALLALFLIVPARHLGLDQSAPATALMLLASALLAFLAGVVSPFRSGWCNSLCPLHPVERLYGLAPARSFANQQCAGCAACSRPCPDSTLSMTPLKAPAASLQRRCGILMTGAFPGFVWGWHQVTPAATLVEAYAWPLLAGALSYLAFALALRPGTSDGRSEHALARVFACAAVLVYYWYRLPAWLDGNESWLWPGRIIMALCLIAFMLVRHDPQRAWQKPPLPDKQPAR